MTNNFNMAYYNYKGELSLRNVVPAKVNYSDNNFYHGEGWIMTAYCNKSQDFRDFSMNDIIKGTIMFTLKSVGETCTPSKVDGIMNKIKEGVQNG